MKFNVDVNACEGGSSGIWPHESTCDVLHARMVAAFQFQRVPSRTNQNSTPHSLILFFLSRLSGFLHLCRRSAHALSCSTLLHTHSLFVTRSSSAALSHDTPAAPR